MEPEAAKASCLHPLHQGALDHSEAGGVGLSVKVTLIYKFKCRAQQCGIL